jgi:glycine/D-amino acid oxidase-like deaminating enzyme
VLLLEKDALASGASGRSSALIRMHYTNEWDTRLAHASFPNFEIAPAVGTCMAELILDGQATTVDIRRFGLRRFAEGRPLEGPYPYAPRRDHLEPAVPAPSEMPRVLG